MYYVGLWILFGIFSAMLASGKKRSTVAWFFIGLLFGPFGLLVALMPELEEQEGITGVPKLKDKQSIVCGADDSETWDTAKAQLSKEMKSRGFEYISANNENVYMLKKDALDSAYVIIERKGGYIYLEFFEY